MAAKSSTDDIHHLGDRLIGPITVCKHLVGGETKIIWSKKTRKYREKTSSAGGWLPPAEIPHRKITSPTGSTPQEGFALQEIFSWPTQPWP
jgi:hypothetical protein